MVLHFGHAFYEILLLVLTISLAALCYSVSLTRKRLLSERIKQISKIDSGHDENEKAASIMARYVESIELNNRLVSQMSQELRIMLLEKQANESDHSIDEIPYMVDVLLKSRIHSENDWKKFRLNFEKFDPRFLRNLENKYYDLTPTEIRIATLIRLEIPTNAMAAMLDVNRKTIYKSRYRLRKKLGYPEQTVDLDKLIKDL